MKIVKISEVIDGINDLIRNKEQEQEQIQALSDEIHSVINLDDALRDKDNEAIKEHFTTLHMNAINLFHLFLEEYIQALNDIKHSVDTFESRTGMIRTDFLREDVMDKLSKIDDITNKIVDDINKQYDKVSDLVVEGRVSTYYFNLNITNASHHAEETATKLETLDEENTLSLVSSENSVDEIIQFITKIESRTKDGVFLTDAKLKEIEDFYDESDIIQKMIDNTEK